MSAREPVVYQRRGGAVSVRLLAFCRPITPAGWLRVAISDGGLSRAPPWVGGQLRWRNCGDTVGRGASSERDIPRSWPLAQRDTRWVAGEGGDLTIRRRSDCTGEGQLRPKLSAARWSVQHRITQSLLAAHQRNDGCGVPIN